MNRPILPPKPLTLAFVRSITAPGKYYDGDGLILNVSAKGAKSWMQRLTVLGRRRDIGIGPVSALTPSAARQIAAKNRAIARAGGNPLDQSADLRAPARAPRVMTLALFSLTLWRRRRATQTHLKAAKHDYRLIRTYITPTLGRRPVAEITPEEIRAALVPVYEDRVSNGEAVRARLMQLFDAVIEERMRPDNPARAPAARPEQRRQRTTSEGDAGNERIFEILPAFLRDLRESPRRPTLLRMVRFTALSLRNPKECRLATWAQMDLANRIWRFPRMQREGVEMLEVPLHDGLMGILEEVRPLRRGDGSGWVFPSSTDFDKPFSNDATRHVTEEFGYDLTMRDFVRVFEWRRAVVGEGYDGEAWRQELGN
jgi:integrase